MDDDIDTLMVEVRANTQGFAADVAKMRSSFDGQLLDGFAKAGDVLERGLLSAIRRGSLGFEDLKRVALGVLDQIAAQALQLGLDGIFGGIGKNGRDDDNGGGDNGGHGGLLAGLLAGLSGLPGRATGGLVSPQRPYLVGERGPELFVPASAGRVEPNREGPPRGRDVRVSIALPPARGTETPVALRRSARQIASAVRRVLGD